MNLRNTVRNHIARNRATALLLVASAASACGTKEEFVFTPDTGTDSQVATDTGVRDTTVNDSGTNDAGDSGAQGERVRVAGEITANTTWTSNNVYVLAGGPVYVINNAVLTIEAGTKIVGEVRDGTRTCELNGTPDTTLCTEDADCSALGASATCGQPREEGTALVIARGSRLIANGTAAAPIVFTSDNLGSATAPSPGDWGGVVLLGRAHTNVLPDPNSVSIEGLPPAEGRGIYGGNDDTHNCGSLQYVRIEYAGYRFGTDNELNGLTVGGCGSQTVLSHIQVHRGLDDGIEFFGGNANLKHAIVTGTGDDSLDMDQGYNGNVQFFIGQQRRVAGEDRCMEIDNLNGGRNNTPVTNPTIFNATCIGAGYTGMPRTGLGQDGVILREGAAGTYRNIIIAHAPDQGLRIQHNETVARLETAASPAITFSNSIIFATGPASMSNYFVVDDHTGGSTGAQFIAALEGLNRKVDPGFAGDVFNQTAPDFRPTAGGAATQMAAAIPSSPAGFFEAAAYVGAVAPSTGADASWYTGWTRFTE